MQALARLDGITADVRAHRANAPFYATGYERFQRAELLREVGRETEALRWYASIPDATGNDVVFLPLAHLRQAEIHDRAGRRQAAAAHYRRFVEIWRDCDPELRPTLEHAQMRLEALGG